MALSCNGRFISVRTCKSGTSTLLRRVAPAYVAVMDFEISEKMQTILEMVRSFMDTEVIPLEGEMLFGDPETLDKAVAHAQDRVRQMGLWASNHPVEFGGLGLSMVEHGLLSEALGRSPLGHLVFGVQAPDAGNVEILHKYATEELAISRCYEFGRRIVDGKMVARPKSKRAR